MHISAGKKDDGSPPLPPPTHSLHALQMPTGTLCPMLRPSCAHWVGVPVSCQSDQLQCRPWGTPTGDLVHNTSYALCWRRVFDSDQSLAQSAVRSEARSDPEWAQYPPNGLGQMADVRECHKWLYIGCRVLVRFRGVVAVGFQFLATRLLG